MLFFSHGQVAAGIRVLITPDRCCHEGILITESCFDESAGLHLTILGISAASALVVVHYHVGIVFGRYCDWVMIHD